MNGIKLHRAHIASTLVTAVAVGAVAFVGLVSGPSYFYGARSTQPPSNAEVQTALGRLGLMPEVLAAAGVSAAETTTVVGNLRTHLGATIESHRTTYRAHEAAAREASLLDRIRRRYDATDEDNQAYQQKRAEIVELEAQRTVLLDAAFAAALAGVARDKIATIETINANRVKWDLALPYMTVDGRTEDNWLQLRDDLANVRIAARFGETPAADSQQRLTTEDARSEVAQARTRLESGRDGVEQAWTSAIWD